MVIVCDILTGTFPQILQKIWHIKRSITNFKFPFFCTMYTLWLGTWSWSYVIWKHLHKIWGKTHHMGVSHVQLFENMITHYVSLLKGEHGRNFNFIALYGHVCHLRSQSYNYNHNSSVYELWVEISTSVKSEIIAPFPTCTTQVLSMSKVNAKSLLFSHM